MAALAHKRRIIDRRALTRDLARIGGRAPAGAARAALLERFKRALADGRAEVRRRFDEGGPGPLVGALIPGLVMHQCRVADATQTALEDFRRRMSTRRDQNRGAHSGSAFGDEPAERFSSLAVEPEPSRPATEHQIVEVFEDAGRLLRVTILALCLGEFAFDVLGRRNRINRTGALKSSATFSASPRLILLVMACG